MPRNEEFATYIGRWLHSWRIAFVSNAAVLQRQVDFKISTKSTYDRNFSEYNDGTLCDITHCSGTDANRRHDE
jgi:hypothetical protein